MIELQPKRENLTAAYLLGKGARNDCLLTWAGDRQTLGMNVTPRSDLLDRIQKRRVDGEQVNGTVYIVDDDALVRASLEVTLRSAGFEAVKFASGTHFLASVEPLCVGCLLADYRMPGMNGVELQAELARRNSTISVIILTGYADVQLAVSAMRNGALDILEKPFKRAQLLALVFSGMARSQETFTQIRVKEEKRALLNTLTDREREVVQFLIAGHTNKEIAKILALSSRTVEVHRAHVMQKLGVVNLPELIRITSGIN